MFCVWFCEYYYLIMKSKRYLIYFGVVSISSDARIIILVWVEQTLCTPCINCWVTCYVVPISKGDGRLQVTSSISHQATYEKGQPESRSCQTHPKKQSCKCLPIRSRTQMDFQMIIKVPFSQKWISLIKCIFYIASDLAENVPSYFIFCHLLTQLLAMLMQPQWYFHLTPNRQFLCIPPSKCDQKEFDTTNPSFGINMGSKTNLWRSQHHCPRNQASYK